jgi:hypothetical protein
VSEEKKSKKKMKDLTTPSPEPVEVIVEEEVEEDGESEGFTVKRPPWIMRVDGLNLDIPLTGLKFPMFTTGMIDRGDVTIETINIPEIALNSYFRSWLMKPLPRKVQIKVLDGAGSDIETWSFSAVPGAMGFSELDVQDDAPWVTQVAFSMTEIQIKTAN